MFKSISNLKFNYLEKKEIDVDCLIEDKKEFIKNRLILKAQQRFKWKAKCIYWRNQQDCIKLEWS